MFRPDRLLLTIVFFILFTACSEGNRQLGQNEAIRVYTEFADGSNRGMYDHESESKGFPDEDYDATTAMVINWHRMPEILAVQDARLRYRRVHPDLTRWETADGESMEFWFRAEKINRVILTGLQPGSVYEFQVSDEGEIFRFRTMPANLQERPVRIIMTADHQSPAWNQEAKDNAKMVALLKPDMFIAAGDFVGDEGIGSRENADRWALYLDLMYGIEGGYFIYEDEIDGRHFNNLIIPHLSVLGNHETGHGNHIRWPACVNTGMNEPGYPLFVAANWMELLFHWPYKSEGFYSEFRPDHPNMDPDQVREGFGKGGFGKLSFSDYLLLIGLDNSQNWEGEPDRGLRDWEGNLITKKWPWFETHHSDVRQDIWLKNLIEPDGMPPAGERYRHILPVWHRGLFGTVRLNMSLKNREILASWLPVLSRNGVKIIKEGHDHSYTRTVPLTVTTEQPENTIIKKVYYEPNSWPLTPNLSREYIEDYYAVNCLIDEFTGDITGWEFEGNYIIYEPRGMIVTGHGGWAASRRQPGGRGGGNAGLWFVDKEKGGEFFGGVESYHVNLITLTNEEIQVGAYHPVQLVNIESGLEIQPIHRFKWNKPKEEWYSFDPARNQWIDYEYGMTPEPEKSEN
jgi:hypothetical protein